jgi:hypothetical protein
MDCQGAQEAIEAIGSYLKPIEATWVPGPGPLERAHSQKCFPNISTGACGAEGAAGAVSLIYGL